MHRCSQGNAERHASEDATADRSGHRSRLPHEHGRVRAWHIARDHESLRHGHDPQQPEAAHAPTPPRLAGKRIGAHVKYFQRELKVCEGCGGLWVRTGTEAGVYCRHCCVVLADLPGRRKRSPGRPCKVRGSGTSPSSLHLVQAAATPAPRMENPPRGRCRREAAAVERLAAERRSAMRLHQGGVSTAMEPLPGTGGRSSASDSAASGACVPPVSLQPIEIARAVSAVPMMYAVAGGAR